MTDDQLHDAELRRLAQQLGKQAADRLDVDGTVGAVLQRLREEAARKRTGRRWWSQPGWLGVAAAVVLVAGAGLVLRLQTGTNRPARLIDVAEDLRSLSTDQLREVLGTLDQTLAEPTTIEPSEDDLNGLTTEQLEQLLQSLEG